MPYEFDCGYSGSFLDPAVQAIAANRQQLLESGHLTFVIGDVKGRNGSWVHTIEPDRCRVIVRNFQQHHGDTGQFPVRVKAVAVAMCLAGIGGQWLISHQKGTISCRREGAALASAPSQLKATALGHDVSTTSRVNATEACERIHRALASRPIWRAPAEVPFSNGLYFHYEHGEMCQHPGGERVVRCGNHPRSQNGLTNRLANHYGNNKNSSAFRKMVGGAMLRRVDPNSACLAPAPGKGHWEKQDAPVCNGCRPYEREVTGYLVERMFFRCVEIVDMRDRDRLEKACIATISSCTICGASDSWLGKYSYNQKARSSGLWQSNHVNEPAEIITHAELARFEQCAMETP